MTNHYSNPAEAEGKQKLSSRSEVEAEAERKQKPFASTSLLFTPFDIMQVMQVFLSYLPLKVAWSQFSVAYKRELLAELLDFPIGQASILSLIW